MAQCVITGATGFIGTTLSRHLRDQGHDVSCLVRATSQTEPLRRLGVRLVEGDVRNEGTLPAAMEGADYVFHLAGRVLAFTPQQFHDVNVEGTSNVARVCSRQSNPPVLVVVSSLAAGGPAAETPRRESDPDRPVSDYGRSKLAAERAIRGFADSLPISVVRPPIVFGPHDREGLTVYRMIARSRVHIVPGARKFRVSMIHVDDLSAAMLLVAERGKRMLGAPSPAGNGEPDQTDMSVGCYYVADGRVVTYGEWGRLVAQALARRVFIVPLPRLIFRAAGGIGEVVGRMKGRPIIVNIDKVREALAPGWTCSVEKIGSELGFTPAAPLSDRIAQTADWYRREGWL